MGQARPELSIDRMGRVQRNRIHLCRKISRFPSLGTTNLFSSHPTLLTFHTFSPICHLGYRTLPHLSSSRAAPAAVAAAGVQLPGCRHGPSLASFLSPLPPSHQHINSNARRSPRRRRRTASLRVARNFSPGWLGGEGCSRNTLGKGRFSSAARALTILLVPFRPTRISRVSPSSPRALARSFTRM